MINSPIEMPSIPMKWFNKAIYLSLVERFIRLLSLFKTPAMKGKRERKFKSVHVKGRNSNLQELTKKIEGDFKDFNIKLCENKIGLKVNPLTDVKN